MSILPNYQVTHGYYLYKCEFNHSRIEVLQNCQAFFFSVSLVKGFFEGTRENISNKYFGPQLIFWEMILLLKMSSSKVILAIAIRQGLLQNLVWIVNWKP